ncbi:MAG TPA: major capsid protein E [Desulfovibrio sp.]|nr:major capsid protein E [Desulfovibrio sp.]
MVQNMANPFNDDAYFGMATLTDQLNRIPCTFGRLNNSGIFKFKGINTSILIIEAKNNRIRIIPATARGGEFNHLKHGKRDLITLVVPHINVEDNILPEEYMNKRKFGTTNAVMSAADVMADFMFENLLSFEVTKEYMKWGALQGIIYGSDGSTVICNFFEEFNVEKRVMYFDLDNDDADIPEKCRELTRVTKKSMQGDVMDYVHVFIHPTFYDKLAKHRSVVEYWKNHEKSVEHLEVDSSQCCRIQGVIFEEFEGEAPGDDEEVISFIKEKKGHAIPMGTNRTFRGVWAPAGFNETVGTEGIEYYMKQEPRKYDMGVDAYMESNELVYCTNPLVLTELDAGAPPAE